MPSPGTSARRRLHGPALPLRGARRVGGNIPIGRWLAGNKYGPHKETCADPVTDGGPAVRRSTFACPGLVRPGFSRGSSLC